jgi:Na+-transporting methylmalonyl-CoA/oxaloacetate decarboxylase gamma subunit
MAQNILLSLQITVIGMGLVFAVILLIWGLMALLAVLPQGRRPEVASTPPARVPGEGSPATTGRQARARIAAVAVAAALAEQASGAARPLAVPPTAVVSAWQLGMRTRQMTQKGARRR